MTRGGVSERRECVREGGISLPAVARFLSADLPSKPKPKTIKPNLSGSSPGPSSRKPIPHTVAGYRLGCPQAFWPAECTCHWTLG